FLKKETILTLGTTSSILALLHNSAQTLAIFASSAAFASETIDNVENYALLTRYTDQLKKYVDNARKAFKVANDPSFANSPFAADDFVRQYANICTVSGLQQSIADSINNTQAVPSDFVSQLISLTANDIQVDLGLSSPPTVADLRELDRLLTVGTPLADR